MAAPRRRLDAELVRRRLHRNTAEARAAIDAGDVLVAGAPASNPGRLVVPGDPITLVPPAPAFVSRSGEKLDGALEHLDVRVEGRRAIDVGASTGGFTDCLLQRGATHVVALDVGHGQLHERLRGDPRVTVIERCNVRDLAPGSMPPAELLVADLSFISLRTVRDALLALVEQNADMVLLVKPQFEARREEAARASGVISDPEVRARTVEDVAEAFGQAGAVTVAKVESNLPGAQGNREVLLHLRKEAQP